LIIPRDIESDWGAIENILLGARNKKIERDEPLEEISVEKNKSVIDEWMPNLEDLKKELKD
jgi:hypothetical protein